MEEQDLFPCIPQEIMIDVFLRLPIKSIGRCKCVCKSWLHLINTREFTDSRLSKSVPCLAFSVGKKSFKALEFVGNSRHDFTAVFRSAFPRSGCTLYCSSVNGLLFLRNRLYRNLLICNPITREYIWLPPRPPKEVSPYRVYSYGFGVSKLSGKYKVLRMYRSRKPSHVDAREFSDIKCEVYTLGTGSWRRIKACYPPHRQGSCIFYNGNLHWFVGDCRDARRISCFDLETECVSTFSAPPLVVNNGVLCALGDHGLCVFENSRDNIVIWSMNEYGDDKSWKVIVIKRYHTSSVSLDFLMPVKIFDNGDILLACRFSTSLYYYSSKTKTSREINLYSLERHWAGPDIYTPSFLSFKTFTMENVYSY